MTQSPPQAANAAMPSVTPLARKRSVPAVTCVVPCHNEAANLAELLPLLAATLDGCAAAWDVIVVDDGSTDGTALLSAAWARQPGFRALQLSRNFGKEAAITAGLQAANGDVVVVLDADLQHPPSLIPTFIDHWRAGADIAFAVREGRSDETPVKRVGTRLFYALLHDGRRFQVPAGAGDFRLMDRSVVQALLALPERNRFMKGLYAWVGFQAVEVPYMPQARAHGSTHYTFMRLLHLALDGLTSFTTWPLRAVTITGFITAVLALAYGAYLTLAYLLNGHEVSGWTTIVVSLMGFAGVQLISLGIVGEYVGRVFEEVKGRPLFVVKRDRGMGPKVVRP